MRWPLAALLLAACAAPPPAAPPLAATPSPPAPALPTASPTPAAGRWIRYTLGSGLHYTLPADWKKYEPGDGVIYFIDPYDGANVQVTRYVYAAPQTLAEISKRWRAAAERSTIVAPPIDEQLLDLPVGKGLMLSYNARWSDGLWGRELLVVFTRGNDVFNLILASRMDVRDRYTEVFAAFLDSLSW